MDKYEILQRCFGYSTFRPGQEQMVDGILSGRDVFGIMPTGGGKSICYQLPAMMMDGISLVVSPLISLMRDQVMSLKAMGVPAAYINSTLTPQQIQLVYRNLLAEMYKIVYVAPERLDQPGFASVAARLKISMVAVDEAHCISQWGQDFRPSYLRIAGFVERLPRRPVVGAFTATATAQVRQDVERLLGLRDPVRTVTGFDRPNLYFQVLKPERKDQALLSALERRRDKSGIVYCATRKNVETVCQFLLDHGFAAARYHAGLEERERTQSQEDFLYDRKMIMVATNAFGMGIDKSNVSFVIHYNMPKSMEAYYQEAGRAGRDGSPADCILLFSRGDVRTAQFLIENSADNEDLDPQTRAIVRAQDLKRLDAMVGYCRTGECLRGYILEYFGQKHPLLCGSCGTCKGNFITVDITREAKMILSCVQQIHEKLGYGVGIDLAGRVLRGSRDKRVLELGLDRLSTYGLMRGVARTPIREMADQLETEGYLVTDQTHQAPRLTPKAAQVLFRGQEVTMRKPLEERQEPPAARRNVVPEEDEALYQRLREVRGRLARKAQVPAYVVFSNATLSDMARRKPRTMSQFRQVSGVGQLKAQWYGQDFLECIREYLDGPA